MKRHLFVLASALLLGACRSSPADGQADAGGAPPPGESASAASDLPLPGGDTPAHRYFGDVPLVDQDGRTLRLYSDVIQGKVVVINAFFSTCNGSCPVMANTFGKIQEQLGDRLGKDVFLVSISVDPVKDTPERLKDFSKRYKAKPGWIFLTGEKDNVAQALKKLGQYVENPNNHKAVMLVGNDRTGLWKKVFGLAEPQEVVKSVMTVVDDTGAPASP